MLAVLAESQWILHQRETLSRAADRRGAAEAVAEGPGGEAGIPGRACVAIGAQPGLDEEAPPGADDAIAAILLAEGDRIRFRRKDGEHWKEGTVDRREADGSLGVRDLKGALLSLPLDHVEVRTTGPRGGVVWEPLPERATRTEQMKLL